MVQMAILSWALRALTTAPQISSPSSNCSPIIASSCIRDYPKPTYEFSEETSTNIEPPPSGLMKLSVTQINKKFLRLFDSDRLLFLYIIVETPQRETRNARYKASRCREASCRRFLEAEQSICHRERISGPPTWAGFQSWSNENLHWQTSC